MNSTVLISSDNLQHSFLLAMDDQFIAETSYSFLILNAKDLTTFKKLAGASDTAFLFIFLVRINSVMLVLSVYLKEKREY